MANLSEFDVYFHGLYGNIDIDLDIFVHSEFEVYLSDVEMARFSQANRWQYLRWMTLAIAAHRQVLNRLPSPGRIRQDTPAIARTHSRPGSLPGAPG